MLGVTWEVPRGPPQVGEMEEAQVQVASAPSFDFPLSMVQAGKLVVEGTQKPIHFFERRLKRCDHINPMGLLKQL